MKINIKNLLIKNFRSIKEANLDFYNNKSGIENELKRGVFKLSPDEKHAIPAYYAIMARNSIGKTTILESLSLISDITNGNVGRIIVQKIFNKEISSPLNLLNSVNPVFKNSHGNLERRDEILDSIKKGKGEWFHEYQSELIKFYKRYHAQYAKEQNTPISISLSLFVEKDIAKVTVTISSDGIVDLNIKSINDPQRNQEILKFVSNMGISSNRFPDNDFTIVITDIRKNLESVEHVNYALMQLLNNFGKEKTLQLLRLADNRIIDMIDVKKGGNTHINSIILQDGSKILLLDLSTGTRQFIIMMCHINVPRFNNFKNGLVLIDEIELSLHVELVNSLKVAMQILFQENNIQFIFTTHNPSVVSSFTSKKQIISLDEKEGVIMSQKMSSILKPQHNIIKAYETGLLSPYPDEELSRNSMVNLFYG